MDIFYSGKKKDEQLAERGGASYERGVMNHPVTGAPASCGTDYRLCLKSIKVFSLICRSPSVPLPLCNPPPPPPGLDQNSFSRNGGVFFCMVDCFQVFSRRPSLFPGDAPLCLAPFPAAIKAAVFSDGVSGAWRMTAISRLSLAAADGVLLTPMVIKLRLRSKETPDKQSDQNFQLCFWSPCDSD